MVDLIMIYFSNYLNVYFIIFVYNFFFKCQLLIDYLMLLKLYRYVYKMLFNRKLSKVKIVKFLYLI